MKRGNCMMNCLFIKMNHTDIMKCIRVGVLSPYAFNRPILLAKVILPSSTFNPWQRYSVLHPTELFLAIKNSHPSRNDLNKANQQFKSIFQACRYISFSKPRFIVQNAEGRVSNSCQVRQRLRTRLAIRHPSHPTNASKHVAQQIHLMLETSCSISQLNHPNNSDK